MPMSDDVPRAVAVVSHKATTVLALCLAVLNILWAQHLTPQGWLIAFALIPLLMHPLKVWTMVAMWPDTDEMDD